MEQKFASEDAKVSFLSRIESVNTRLARSLPEAHPPWIIGELLSSLLEMAEVTPSNQPADSRNQLQSQTVPRSGQEC